MVFDVLKVLHAVGRRSKMAEDEEESVVDTRNHHGRTRRCDALLQIPTLRDHVGTALAGCSTVNIRDYIAFVAPCILWTVSLRPFWSGSFTFIQ